MQNAAAVASEVATLPDAHSVAARREGPAAPDAASDAPVASAEKALARLEYCAKALGDLRRGHRSETLGAVANGGLSAGDAMARVDTVRNLEALAHHAWRSAAHLVGRASSLTVS
jgi:phosphate:Na+ symporter